MNYDPFQIIRNLYNMTSWTEGAVIISHEPVRVNVAYVPFHVSRGNSGPAVSEWYVNGFVWLYGELSTNTITWLRKEGAAL